MSNGSLQHDCSGGEEMAPQAGTSATATTPGRKRGGQPGNLNAMKSGLRSLRFMQGKPPQGCSYISRDARLTRRELEQDVLSKRQGISIHDAALISAVESHERSRLLAVRWLAKEGSELGVLDRVSLLKDISKFVDLRNAALAKLELGHAGADGFDPAAFYRSLAQRPTIHDVPPTTPPGPASGDAAIKSGKEALDNETA